MADDSPPKPLQEIEVTYRVDGTTKTDRYTATAASITMMRHGKTIIELVGGADQHGPVLTVQYQEAARVVRRLVAQEDHRD